MQDFYFESVSLWTENICVPVNRVCACFKCACMIFAEHDEMIIVHLADKGYKLSEGVLSRGHKVSLSRDLEKMIPLFHENGGN